MRMSQKEYKKLVGKSETANKYKNVKTEIDGHVFDSKAEAKRYAELKILVKVGEIQGFGLQPSFVLDEKIRYRPDFIVCGKDGSVWVEDVKGMETKEFSLKKRLWINRYPWLELRIIK